MCLLCDSTQEGIAGPAGCWISRLLIQQLETSPQPSNVEMQHKTEHPISPVGCGYAPQLHLSPAVLINKQMDTLYTGRSSCDSAEPPLQYLAQ